QSGLLGENAPDSSSGRALWHSESRQYPLAEGQDRLVVDLTYANQGIQYTKRFTFARGQYDLKVEYLIDTQSGRSEERRVGKGGVAGRARDGGAGTVS